MSLVLRRRRILLAAATAAVPMAYIGLDSGTNSTAPRVLKLDGTVTDLVTFGGTWGFTTQDALFGLSGGKMTACRATGWSLTPAANTACDISDTGRISNFTGAVADTNKGICELTNGFGASTAATYTYQDATCIYQLGVTYSAGTYTFVLKRSTDGQASFTTLTAPPTITSTSPLRFWAHGALIVVASETVGVAGNYRISRDTGSTWTSVTNTTITGSAVALVHDIIDDGTTLIALWSLTTGTLALTVATSTNVTSWTNRQTFTGSNSMNGWGAAVFSIANGQYFMWILDSATSKPILYTCSTATGTFTSTGLTFTYANQPGRVWYLPDTGGSKYHVPHNGTDYLSSSAGSGWAAGATGFTNTLNIYTPTA